MSITRIGLSLLLTASLTISGCATPAAFVSTRTLTPEAAARFQSFECGELAERLAKEKETEQRLSDEMTKRAGTQLLLNALAVGALAAGGVGFAYSVHGEGYRREVLGVSRGEIEAMQKVLTDKTCKPDTPKPPTVADAEPALAPALEATETSKPTAEPSPQPK
jgi:hypothetical protein